MKTAQKTIPIILTILIMADAQTYDKYIWESHRATGINDPGTVLAVLRAEIDKIIAAGHLRPLRSYHSDVKAYGYFMYPEPGRIITTLAMAYPYLTMTQQQQVQTYIRNEIASANYTPWSSSASLPATSGTFRNYALMADMPNWDFYWGETGQNRPRLHTLYGVWLYAYNSGDTSVVQNNWTAIKSFYSSHSNEGTIYGEFCGHIAMARMAHMMSDNATMNTAVANANAQFAAGLNFSDDSAKAEAFYSLTGFSYGGGLGRQTIHEGFMFVNMTPEVGRYLSETSVKNAVIAKNNEGKKKFPLWWLYKAPYFTVWGGEEGVGLIPEIVGQIFPVERWVAGTSLSTLRSYQIHRAVYGIGDCYTLEAIINTINADGTQTWADVRTNGPVQSPVRVKRSLSDLSLVNGFSLRRLGDKLALRYTVVKQSTVTIALYDLSGRQHTVPNSSVQMPGSYAIIFKDAIPSAGVYLARMSAVSIENGARYTITKALTQE